MTALLRQLDVQAGLHASENDFTTTPGTLRRLQIIGGGESLMPRRLMEISRNDITALDGRGFSHLYGPVDVEGPCAPVTEFKGVDSNTGAAVAAASWAPKMEQADLLTSFFGALPVATTSAAPTVAAGGHSTTTLVTVGTALLPGEFVLFPTSAGNVIRQVVSNATFTATLDRAYSGTPTTGGTVIRAARWVWDPSLRNPTHIGINAEIHAGWLAKFTGCAPSQWALAIPTAGKLTSTWTMMPTGVDGLEAPVAPTVTFATAGVPIVGLNTELWIGSESLRADNLAVSLNNGVDMRTTPTGPNGRYGGIAAEKRGAFQITFSVRSELQARGGVERNTGTETLRTLLGVAGGSGVVSSTRDVLLHVGRSAGAAMALRMPTADVQATIATVGTAVGINVTVTATTTASLGVF
jgi:hypothetical protein